MPKFSQASFSKLSTCHPDLQTLFFEVIRHYDCKIIEGFRGEDAQNQAYAEQKSKLKWPDGKHNNQPSHAVDVAPYPIDWSNKSRFYWFAGYVMAVADMLRAQGKMTYAVRWGGNWAMDPLMPKQDFNDLLHYELVI